METNPTALTNDDSLRRAAIDRSVKWPVLFLFGNAAMWLLAATGPPGARFYFVRSGTTTVHDNVGEYHLVVPTMALTELGAFSEQFRLAKSGDAKFADCVVGIDQFLHSMD